MSKGVGILSQYIQDSRNARSAHYLHGKRVLDVGCNEGYLRTILPKDVEYVGMDVHSPQRTDFTFHKRSVMDDLSDLGTFDTIFLLATIEHLDNYTQAISNLVSRLNEGGVLIITTPSKMGDSLHHLGAKVRLVSLEAAEDHEKIFTLNELKELMRQNHLELVTAHTFMLGLNQLVVGRKQ